MAKFSKWNQPKNKNGGRPLNPNSKTAQKRAQKEQKEKEQEATAFAKFENEEYGYFNGFCFVNEFHKKYNKSAAIERLTADDCADVTTSTGSKIHVGEDGITVYIMTETAQNGNAKKYVEFNRSIYVF